MFTVLPLLGLLETFLILKINPFTTILLYLLDGTDLRDSRQGGIIMADRNQFFAGLIVGAAVGAVAGLLLTPSTGKETRQIVAARAGEVREKAGQFATSARERIRRGQTGEESAGDHVREIG